MTAAVIPSALLPPVHEPAPSYQPTPPHQPTSPKRPTTDRQISDPPPDRPANTTPYLVPVPDCEPPYDGQVGNWLVPRPRHPAGTGEASQPTNAGQLIGPLPKLTGAAVGASHTHPAAEPPAELNPAREDSMPALDRRPTGRTDPRQPSNRQHGDPRSTRSAGLSRPARADVLLLEPARKARPTTIAAPGVPPWSSEADIGVRKTASEHLPPADRAASVLARALVEVLSGQRPLAQLRVHCAPEIYAGLGGRPPVPQLALPHLLTVRVCEPADGVAEVSVAYRRADRVKALAFRIEGVDGRWRITALQLG